MKFTKHLALAILLLFGCPVTAEEPVYDLVIRNGRVIDGSGNPWFLADLAVKDPVAFGVLASQAKEKLEGR